MADALVPYGDTRIVLRHHNSVVLYDPSNRKLVVRSLDNGPLEPTACPHCRRPYHVNEFADSSAPSHDHVSGDARPEYFHMLQQSLPASASEQAVPSSPVKQLVEPVLSPASTPRSSTPSAAPAPVRDAAGISSDALSPGYFSRFFQDEGELGRGGKGVVLRVRHVLDGVPLGLYACKRIPVGNDHRWLVKILAEVQLLSDLAHENLVQYKHVWLEEVKLANFGPSVPCAFVLQQFCNQGDLQKYICGSKPALSPAEELKARHRRHSKSGGSTEPTISSRIRRLTLDEIYSFFKQITAGINYLHMNNYVHRDLKPSNCLLHDTGSELRVLVSDFGEVQRGEQIREGTGATGTISYCAPEVLKLDDTTGQLGEFTTKSDIFSLGMVLHFLCFGQLPYHGTDGIDEEDEDVEQLKDEISKWAGFEQERHLRSDLPDELYQNLSHLLSINSSHRPSAQHILQGLESLGGYAASGSQPHHMRTRSSERVFDRRGSKASVSRLDSQSPRMHSSAIAPAPPARRRVTPPKSNEDDIAVASDDERLSKSDSLILRPRVSQNASRTVSPLKETPVSAFPVPPPRMSPRLLPSPSTSEAHVSQQAYLSGSRLRTLEIGVFCLKLLSLYYICLPVSVRPVIALPLTLFALIDFLKAHKSLWQSLAWAAIHIFVLVGIGFGRELCIRSLPIFDPEDGLEFR